MNNRHIRKRSILEALVDGPDDNTLGELPSEDTPGAILNFTVPFELTSKNYKLVTRSGLTMFGNAAKCNGHTFSLYSQLPFPYPEKNKSKCACRFLADGLGENPNTYIESVDDGAVKEYDRLAKHLRTNGVLPSRLRNTGKTWDITDDKFKAVIKSADHQCFNTLLDESQPSIPRYLPFRGYTLRRARSFTVLVDNIHAVTTS